MRHRFITLLYVLYAGAGGSLLIDSGDCPGGELGFLRPASLEERKTDTAATPSRPGPRGLAEPKRTRRTPPTRFIYKTVGDRQLALYVSYPPDWKAGDRRSAIVFFFGGGWTRGQVTQFQPQAEYLAERGMVAIRADYRVKSRDGVAPDRCVEDALSAMRWVRSRAGMLGIDPDRIVASGGSAGGHLAACTFFTEGIAAKTDDARVSPRPNAMVLYNPALDFLALRDSGRRKYAKNLTEETMLKISPLRHVRKKMPPTLILDGTKDFLYGQNKAFVDKAEAVGAPVQVFWAEGATHGFFNRSPWLEKTTARVDAFLQSIGFLDKGPKVALPTGRLKRGKRSQP